MSRARLFVEVDPHAPDRARLEGFAARHVAALRLRVGDSFDAITAPGEERCATIESIGRGRVECRLGDVLARPALDPTRELALAIGLADDPARLDLVVEKATELGATRILPFRAARSQRASVGAERLARWARIARSACEQCGRTVPPEIAAPVDLAALRPAPGGGALLLLACVPGAPPLDAVAAGAVTVVVGPEGGLTPDELAQLAAQGARAVGLGPRTLRFDTAAIAALVLAGRLLAAESSP